MEVTAATCAVSVTKEFLVTRKLDGVPRGVHRALKEYTVTKVKKNSLWTIEYFMNSHDFVKSIRQ